MSTFAFEEVQKTITTWKPFLDRFVEAEDLKAKWRVSTEYDEPTPCVVFKHGDVRVELWPAEGEVRIDGEYEDALDYELSPQARYEEFKDAIDKVIATAQDNCLAVDVSDSDWPTALLDQMDNHQHELLIECMGSYFDHDFLRDNLPMVDEVDRDDLDASINAVNQLMRRIKEACDGTEEELSQYRW
jgi:hypothetical protein